MMILLALLVIGCFIAIKQFVGELFETEEIGIAAVLVWAALLVDVFGYH